LVAGFIFDSIAGGYSTRVTGRWWDGIDFRGGWGYARRQLKKEPRGFLWPRRRLKSVRIRVAIVRRHRAASIAALIVKGLRTGHPLPATVITRNALSKNLKHSSGNDYGGCDGVRIVRHMLSLVRWPACGAIR
jgi:hypothetical protein